MAVAMDTLSLGSRLSVLVPTPIVLASRLSPNLVLQPDSFSPPKPSRSSKIRKYSSLIAPVSASLNLRSTSHDQMTRRFGLRRLRVKKFRTNTFVSITTTVEPRRFGISSASLPPVFGASREPYPPHRLPAGQSSVRAELSFPATLRLRIL